MNIAICDDDNNILTYLNYTLDTILKSDCKIFKFHTGSALELYIDDNKCNLDILIIDIDLGDENGIEIAKRIKVKYYNIKIIFITGFINYSQNIFEAEPTYFIAKPIKIENLTNALNLAIKSIENDKPNVLSLSSKGVVVSINLKKIKYIESVKRQVIIHETDDIIKIYSKLKDIENHLPSNFVRCHQSYIVNMDKTKYLNNHFFLLYDGQNIPISQSRYNKTKQKYLDYLGCEM